MPLENLGVTSYKKRLMVLKWPTLQQRRLFSSLTECYKTINSLNGLDPSKFFTFARVFRPLKANHRFKLKSVSATLHSFNIFVIRIIDKWNNLPKEIADVENLNIFTSILKRYLTSVSVGILNYVDISSDMIFLYFIQNINRLFIFYFIPMYIRVIFIVLFWGR